MEGSDLLPVHAEALTDLAEILRLAGQPAAAVPVLDEAMRLWDEKRNVVAAVRTREARARASAR